MSDIKTKFINAPERITAELLEGARLSRTGEIGG